jgi:hypothetical protein
MLLNGLENRRQLLFIQQRRCASSKIHAAQNPLAQVIAAQFHFADQGFDQSSFLPQRGAEVKVAIVASLLAKWDVEVEQG